MKPVAGGSPTSSLPPFRAAGTVAGATVAMRSRRRDAGSCRAPRPSRHDVDGAADTPAAGCSGARQTDIRWRRDQRNWAASTGGGHANHRLRGAGRPPARKTGTYGTGCHPNPNDCSRRCTACSLSFEAADITPSRIFGCGGRCESAWGKRSPCGFRVLVFLTTGN